MCACASFLPEEPPFEELCSSSDVVLKPASKLPKPRRKRMRARRDVPDAPAETTWDQFFQVPALLSHDMLQLLKAFPKAQFFFGKDFRGFDQPGALDLFSFLVVRLEWLSNWWLEELHGC